MPKRYYELSENLYIPGRWYLADPLDERGQEVDPWMFRAGQPVPPLTGLQIPLYRPGLPLDFSTTGVGVTPIVHHRVAALLRELAPDDVQLLPVHVESQSEPYSLVNVTRLVKCIDDQASERVRYWLPEDQRPDKTGKYRNVVGLCIDPSSVGDARVFRPWGWTVVLLVSEEVKAALEALGATGMRFTEV